MRLHPHWLFAKRLSTHYRICRLCGDIQRLNYTGCSSYPDSRPENWYWGSIFERSNIDNLENSINSDIKIENTLKLEREKNLEKSKKQKKLRAEERKIIHKIGKDFLRNKSKGEMIKGKEYNFEPEKPREVEIIKYRNATNEV
jgi:hypothetical protein